MSTCIILNTNAGSLDDPDALKEKIRGADLGEFTLHCPDSGEEAIKVATEAINGGCTRIIIAGGDGSLNDMVQVVFESGMEVELGLIPLGTGNDFARTMEIPEEVEEAIAILEAGHSKAIDLIQISAGDEHHYAVNVSGGGFTGAVDEALSDGAKARLGVLAYAKAVVESLPNLEAHCATITIDGGDPLDLDLWNVFVCNGRFVGGGTLISPEALPDDGLLDVVLVEEGTGPDLLTLVPKGLRGIHLEHPLVTFRQAKRVSISSVPPMLVNADGELLERGNRTWEVLPGALRFVCPA